MFIMTSGRMIEEHNRRQNMTDEERQEEEEWSLDECKRRGCLPTGEPIDALYGYPC